MTIREHLKSIGACQEAIRWANQFETAQEVYENNTRVDWLFWWSAKTGNISSIVEAAQEIAESVKHGSNNKIAAMYAADAAAYAYAAYAYAAAYAEADNAAIYAADAADAAAAAAADAAAANAAAYAAANADAAADCAANAAAYADNADIYAAYTDAYEEQKAKNLQIAKKHCLLPWSETLESKETK